MNFDEFEFILFFYRLWFWYLRNICLKKVLKCLSLLIHYELAFVCGMRKEKSLRSSFYMWIFNFILICWTGYMLFPVNCLGIFVKYQRNLNIRIYFWILNYVSLIHSYPFCQCYIALITAAL